MNPLNTKPNTYNKKNLSEKADSAPELSSKKAADKKEELGRAPSLSAAPEAEKSIQDRHPEVKQEEAPTLSAYELLLSLPNELKAEIIQYWDQESVCNFIKSLSEDIEAAGKKEDADRQERRKALINAKVIGDDAAIKVLEEEEKQSLAIGNRHWSIQLFDLCLNEMSCDIDFSQKNIRDVLEMAKSLGLKTPTLSTYELLLSLPNELKAKIIQYWDQESVCNFIKSLSEDIEEARKKEDADRQERLKALNNAKASGNDAAIKVLEEEEKQSLDIGNRHWSIQLFDLCLNEMSCDIDLSEEDIRDVLNRAKRLGLKEVFNQVPSLKIVTQPYGLSWEEDIKPLLEGMTIGVKSLYCHPADLAVLDFSTQYFPHLEGLRVVNAYNLKLMKVNDKSGVLKKLTVAECEELRTIDISNCGQLNYLECDSLNKLKTIYMPNSKQLEEFTLKNHTLVSLGLKLDNLAWFLNESCVKLRLTNIHIKDYFLIGGFISKLKKLREIDVRSISSENERLASSHIKLKDLSSLVSLEKVSFEYSKVDLAGYVSQQPLKTFTLGDGCTIDNPQCLEEIRAEALDLELSAGEDFEAEWCPTLVRLKNLRSLCLRILPTTNLEFLKQCTSLERLKLSGKQHQSLSLDLASLAKLKKLELSYVNIENLDFSEHLKDLEELELDSCPGWKQEHLDSLDQLSLTGKFKLLIANRRGFRFPRKNMK